MRSKLDLNSFILIYLAQNRDYWQMLVNEVMNLRSRKTWENFNYVRKYWLL